MALGSVCSDPMHSEASAARNARDTVVLQTGASLGAIHGVTRPLSLCCTSQDNFRAWRGLVLCILHGVCSHSLGAANMVPHNIIQ